MVLQDKKKITEKYNIHSNEKYVRAKFCNSNNFRPESLVQTYLISREYRGDYCDMIVRFGALLKEVEFVTSHNIPLMIFFYS
jgi:hypothetical protein